MSAPQLVPPVLFGEMAAGLRASQAHVTALVPASSGLGTLLFAFPASLFMERVGVHRSFMLGISVQCILLSAQVASARLWHFVALQFLVGACAGFTFPAGFVAFCNVWFGEQSSTAIGITFSAFGVAGAVWTTVTAYVATEFGWRAALGVAAIAQWCVALPLAVFAMRDPPASAPPRVPSPVARRQKVGEDVSPWWWVSDGSVWLLVLLTFCVLYATFSINYSVTLFFKDEAGVSLQRASFFTSLIFACNFVGKLASGLLYDSRHGNKFSVGACVLLLVGCGILCRLSLQPTAGPEAVVFAVVFGLGYGMSYSLVQSKAALHFGHRCGFKALQGFLVCWQAAGQIIGELITPELAHAASYSASFSLICVVVMVAVAAAVAFEVREASFDMRGTPALADALLK